MATGALVALVVAAWLGLVEVGRRAQRRLDESRRTMARLVEESQAVTAAARDLLVTQRFDLAAVASTPLAGRILHEFVGYEQLTRRGNRFRVEELSTEFRDGHVVVRARADFDWRLGLYHGPIAVTYLGFARLSPAGECFLYFRVADVRTLASWGIFNRWLAPILTVRMQRRLEIPDLRLPLGGGGDPDGLAEPGRREGELALERRLGGDGAGEGPGAGSGGVRVRVAVPRASWSFGGRRALAFVTADELGLVVERPLAAAFTPGAESAGDLRLAVRLDFLAEHLTRGLQGAKDFNLEIDRLPRVWQRRATVLGVEFDNYVDLEHLDGDIDVERLDLDPQPQGVRARLALTARVSGVLDGKLFGVAASLPFRAAARADEAVPLRVVGTSGGLRLATDRETLTVPVAVEARLASQVIRFTTPLAIPWSDLVAAVRIPDMVHSHISIPTLVERGEVRARRTLPIEVDWQVELPTEASGLLRAWSVVAVGEASTPRGSP